MTALAVATGLVIAFAGVTLVRKSRPAPRHIVLDQLIVGAAMALVGLAMVAAGVMR